MADRVDRILERDLHSINDLDRLGLMSPIEIRAIIDRRRSIEYTLQRRQPLRHDFHRAITFELDLERLINQRIAKSNAASTRSSECLRRIRQRAFALYDRTVQKFPADVALWIEFLDYARSIKSSKGLSVAFTRALQLHPTKADLWIKTMAWEFDVNNNIDGARVLMQRALRMIPRNTKIWLAFFRLELQYIRRLTARRSILAIDGGEKDEEFLSGAIPLLIYRQAVNAVPDQWQFRTQFLQLVDGDEHHQLIATIITDITQSFPHHHQAITACAQRLNSPSPFDIALQTAHGADVNEIWMGYLRWAMHDPSRAALLEELISRAPSSSSVRALMIERACHDGRDGDAIVMCEAAINDDDGNDHIWSHYCQLNLQRALIGDNDIDDSLNVHDRACNRLPTSLPLHLLRLRAVIALKPTAIHKSLIASLSANLSTDDQIELKRIAAELIRSHLDDGRSQVMDMVCRAPTTATIVHRCLSMMAGGESSAVEIGRFEAAVAMFGATSAEIWKLMVDRIASYDVKSAQHVQWRARSALKDPAAFDLLVINQ